MPGSSNKKNQSVQNLFPNPLDILEDAPIGIFTSTPEGRFIAGALRVSENYKFE